MKAILTLAAALLLAAASGEAPAQYGYYGGYSPYHGPSYYGGAYPGFGTRTFSYQTTLPGGGYYGYSTGPGYSGVVGTPYGGHYAPYPYVGYTYPAGYAIYPGYYYRPGRTVFFDN